MRVKNSEISAVVEALEQPHDTPEQKAQAIIKAFLREYLSRDSLHIILYPNNELGIVFAAGPYPTRGDAQRAAADGLTPDAVLTDCEAALEALGELNGKHIRDDLVDTIFSRFCVGK